MNWTVEIPPRDALWTAEEWLQGTRLSSSATEVFGYYVANLWRAETGLIAGKASAGRVALAAIGSAYTDVWNAWITLAGARSEQHERVAVENALRGIAEEGLSMDCFGAEKAVRRAWAANPDAQRVDYIVLRTRKDPRKGAAGRLVVLSKHVVMRAARGSGVR